jgi:predicted GIY-YIG superfamily endonuclease
MIQRLKNKGRREWNVYVLRCGDGTLYTGVAKNIEERLKQHRHGKGAAYTRTHLPVELVYEETKLTMSEALIREAGIKRMPRASKEKLIFRVA